jgi:hypothetical protein
VGAVTVLAERRFVCLALGTQDLEFGVAVAAMIFINRHDANLTGKLNCVVKPIVARFGDVVKEKLPSVAQNKLTGSNELLCPLVP